MKLKSQPEDFEVEELSDFPFDGGAFAVYQLTKRSIGTPEAITSISERWNISRRAIGYGGLKDKHAVTRQWVTILRGPRRDFRQDKLSLTYQGQASRHFGPQDISANRFRIVLRNLSANVAKEYQDECELIARHGIPNYYDDQRFGSLGESGEFIARPWCCGNYERALWLAIAEPNSHDRPRDRDEKEVVRHFWGNWEKCKMALSRSSCRSIITYLVDHPDRFREAFALLRQDLRSLWLAAYQSDLWNRCLAATLRQKIADSAIWNVPLATVDAAFFRELSGSDQAALSNLQLPLPSARLHLDQSPMLELYEKVIGEQGLALRELRVKYPRDSFFSKGERHAVVRPAKMKVEPVADDDLNPFRHRATLQFELPRGTYATILVKRLTMVDLGESG